ncbi:MAG: EAL and HDOD domain-containing protein [Chloroflexota bacterium]
MKVFVARQAIFDQRERVFAYELLFRSGAENVFLHPDGDLASQVVMSHGLHVFGLDELTHQHRAFINFTRSLLVRETARLLPSDKIVVEILETVEPDAEVIQACRALKRWGYLLALDDFVARPGDDPLIALADFIKVDFRQSPGPVRRALAQRFLPRKVTLVAEKVETPDDFAEGRSLGYSLFQGYFFCKPEVVSREDVPARKLHYLRLLREINRPDVDFDEIERLIKEDVALSIKLLRYINSAWFGLSRRVTSLRHALVLLGIRTVRQWAALVAVTTIASDKPAELIAISLLRATFCERLAAPAHLDNRASDLFLVGLFSSLDALIDRPLGELLREVAVPDAVRDALLGLPTRLSPVYRLVLAYEQGDWDGSTELARALELDEKILPDVFSQSVRWVDQVLAS